jgi:hypothetical protein
MRQSTKQGRSRTMAIATMAALTAAFLVAPSRLMAGSATALVSATVLGPAETEIASGAVTVSQLSESDRIDVIASGGSQTRLEARSLSTFRIGGGFHSSYAVTLPETVTAKNGGAELAISGFHTTSGADRLASDGTASFGVAASMTIPGGQTPGTYTGSYSVTVAYN